MIPTPAPDRVPCADTCGHCDCASARQTAASRCVICENRVGYDTPFRRLTGSLTGPVAHATCSTPRHDTRCLDDDGVLDLCVCGLSDPHPIYDSYDPDDREPMAGDPYWQENR